MLLTGTTPWQGYVLAAEDLDVESTSVPYADSKDEDEECTAPEWTSVENENGG